VSDAKPGRNAACPCGSGRKYKHCCGAVRQMRVGNAPPDTRRSVPRVSSVKNRAREAELQFQLLTRLRQAGRFAESLEPLRQLVRLNPENPNAHHDLGLTYRLCSRLPEAIASFQRAIALKPDYASAHYNLGVSLEQQGYDTAAVPAYRRAVALSPKLVDAHTRLGILLVAQGYTAEGVECFRRAAAASSDPTVRRLNEAKVLLFGEQYAEAEASLRRTIAIAPKNAEAHRIIGLAIYRMGRFEDAVKCFEQAIALDPNDASVYYYLIISKKITAADRPVLDRMLALLATPGLEQRDRISLHYGLGKAFDDLAEYDQAIRHFDEANRLVRLDLAFDGAALAAENDRLIALFTPDFLRTHTGLGATDETPIFVLGMPRSGTTLVEQIISAHPRVGAGDELTFWHERLAVILEVAAGGLTPAFVDQIAADYRALLHRMAPDKSRVTDKMPANFRLIGPIHLVFPRARIIHCRRHPIDTCLSNLFTQFNKVQSHTHSRSDLVFYYREYARMMGHWRRVLPPDRFLEIDYETLVADREQMTRRLIEFSGLDWNDACLRPERNDRVVKTASLWQARQSVYNTSVERWRRYEPWLGELRQLLPD
jgi:tetratricopeptide (TPR) repeat protein